MLSRRKCGGLIVWHFSINRTKNQGGKYTYKDIPSILHVVRVARGFIRFCFFFFLIQRSRGWALSGKGWLSLLMRWLCINLYLSQVYRNIEESLFFPLHGPGVYSSSRAWVSLAGALGRCPGWSCGKYTHDSLSPLYPIFFFAPRYYYTASSHHFLFFLFSPYRLSFLFLFPILSRVNIQPPSVCIT